MFSESTTTKIITAKPSKIVAGLEVTKTLELLLAIASGIEMNVRKHIYNDSTNIILINLMYYMLVHM